MQAIHFSDDYIRTFTEKTFKFICYTNQFSIYSKSLYRFIITFRMLYGLV